MTSTFKIIFTTLSPQRYRGKAEFIYGLVGAAAQGHQDRSKQMFYYYRYVMKGPQNILKSGLFPGYSSTDILFFYRNSVVIFDQ